MRSRCGWLRDDRPFRAVVDLQADYWTSLRLRMLALASQAAVCVREALHHANPQLALALLRGLRLLRA